MHFNYTFPINYINEIMINLIMCREIKNKIVPQMKTVINYVILL